MTHYDEIKNCLKKLRSSEKKKTRSINNMLKSQI